VPRAVESLTEIVNLYADAMLKMGAEFDKDTIMADLADYLTQEPMHKSSAA